MSSDVPCLFYVFFSNHGYRSVEDVHPAQEVPPAEGGVHCLLQTLEEGPCSEICCKIQSSCNGCEEVSVLYVQ